MSGVGTLPSTADAVEVTINSFGHTWPEDLGIVLVGPTGAALLLQDGAGAAGEMSGVTYKLSDAGTDHLPDVGPWDAGTYKPTAYYTGDPFPSPGPGTTYSHPGPAGGNTATFASTFGGTNADGVWRLFVVDFAGGDGGSLAGGWTLTFNGEGGGECPTTGSARADFDGDGRTDISVFRQSNGIWYQQRSTEGFTGYAWGLSTDVLVPGDYDGDGRTDGAIYRVNADGALPDFYVLRSSDFTVMGVSWGYPGDVPAIGDFDGDGRTDYGVFRQVTGVWYILAATGENIIFSNPGDTPVPADYDGDGKTDGIVYTNGTWSGQLSGGGTMNVTHGEAGDKLVPGDYDGDGIDDVAVFRPSNGTWYILKSTGGTQTTVFGSADNIPVPGDYDGDGKEDIAVFKPNGQWWVLGSSAGVYSITFGFGTDIPIVAFAHRN